jgi:cardiolipin synthase
MDWKIVMHPDLNFDVFEIGWAISVVAAVLTAPSVLINRRARPVAAVSWLLALFALPPAALVAWWLFGRTHLSRRRHRRRRASEEIGAALARRHPGSEREVNDSRATSRLVPSLPMALRESVFRPTNGNSITFLADTKAVHRVWRGLIEEAKEHVHVFFFAWHDDETGRAFLDMLERKSAEGVAVRVLYDAVGCTELPKHFFDRLRKQGGRVATFMPIKLLTLTPLLNFRNHRKLVISDGRRAYTGGINVTDEYLQWRDIGVEVAGPAVNALQEVFVDDWYFATSEELISDAYFPRMGSSASMGGSAICQAIASGPDQVFNTTRDMLFMAIAQTRHRLWISTPYFIPDDALMVALRTAVYRGIDLKLFVPGKSDNLIVRRASRAYYGAMIAGGVPIFEYDGMLHAKAILFDDDNALIGSANLDVRSFRLNFELSVLIESNQLNSELADWFTDVSRRSLRVEREYLGRRSYPDQVVDALANLLSPLL